MASYRWDSPHAWLIAKAQDWSESTLYRELVMLAHKLDADQLQDEYQDLMSADGYFNDLDIVNKLSREQCVQLLESIGIQCFDEVLEPVETLRTAVAANLADDTLAYSNVEEVANG